MATQRELENSYWYYWNRYGLAKSDIQRQYKFHPTRRWRFDFAFPSQRLAVEINGMGRGGQRGGHQTAQGMRNDTQKLNSALLLGWRVLIFTSADYNAEEWVRMTCLALCNPSGLTPEQLAAS